MNNQYTSSIIKSVSNYLYSNYASDCNSKDLDQTDLASIAKAVFRFYNEPLALLNSIKYEYQQSIIDAFEESSKFNLLEENYEQAFPNKPQRVQFELADTLFVEFLFGDSYYCKRNIFTPDFMSSLYDLIDQAFDDYRHDDYMDTPQCILDRSEQRYEQTRSL